ncbi:MAG: SGNH/GDSL hydrolase family protein [Planctomycetota bacterium]
MKRLLVAIAVLGSIASSGQAQISCPAAKKPAVCTTLVPGTPLPYTNSAAPKILDMSKSTSYELVIIGHSENRGYHTPLKALIAKNPLVPGKTFTVYNDWIGGHEAFRWATKGQRGYTAIDNALKRQKSPMIVLALTSNNASRPIKSASTNDANFNLFVQNLESIADHIHNGGKGAMMVYFSSHRYKPGNFTPSYLEKCAVGHMISVVEKKKKVYIKAGPEQHDLHWCCYPSCYARDLAHTNAAGDQLMAQAWYNFLLREMTGAVMEPYGSGTVGSGGFVPVLSPAGGAPNVGNQGFSLAVSQARSNAALVYAIGGKKQPGPILTSLDLFVFAKTTGTGSGKGSHRLTVGLPNNASLVGVKAFVQAAVDDPAASLGLALTQGLELVVGR